MSKIGFIYKIVCKDVAVKEIYVGSTTNLKVRKCAHKSSCNNINSKTIQVKFIIIYLLNFMCLQCYINYPMVR